MKLLNAINIGKDVVLAHILNRKTPINIMWRITNKCTAKCGYCDIWQRKQIELTTEQILSLIDQMVICGTQRIGFIGGEALLKDDFEKIVDYVKNKGIYITLVSNGCIIPNKMGIIKKLDCLVLSFDGKQENHDRGRIKGSFNDLMKAFQICKKNKIKVITITVLNKYNLDDIDYIINTAQKYKFKCNFHVLHGGSEYYPLANEYRRSFSYLIKRKKEGAPIILSLKTLNFLKKWPDYRKFLLRKNIKGFRCWAGELIFNIDVDGSIAACDVMRYLLDNNPNCIEVGFEKAYKSVRKNGCKACASSPLIEYNYMFSLNASVILDWGKFIFGK